MAGAIGYAAYCGYRVVYVVVPECYAQEWAALTVIEYLKQHNDQWPRSWDDLDESYRAAARHYSRPPLADVRYWVDVQFDGDPQLLRSTPLNESAPPFYVIYLKGGGRHHWSGRSRIE